MSPEAGIYTEPQEVTMTCETEGARIKYTTDGSNPDETSTIYSSPVQISTSTTLKARSFKQDWAPSLIATAVYTIEDLLSDSVAIPVFNPSGGVFDTAQSVTISCATSGATIRYTTYAQNAL